MQLFEMQGLLAGKCLPGNMFVGESLAEYFLRQFNQRDELARQVSALQLSHDDIINSLGIKGDGPVSKLVIEYVLGWWRRMHTCCLRLQVSYLMHGCCTNI